MTSNRRLALKVREAAEALGVGRDAVYNAINRGRSGQSDTTSVKEALRGLVDALGA